VVESQKGFSQLKGTIRTTCTFIENETAINSKRKHEAIRNFQIKRVI